MKRFLCRVFGHKWQSRHFLQIQDDYNNRRRLRLVECQRCGATAPK